MGVAENDLESMVRLLLEKGADTEFKSSRGNTRLLLAAEKGHNSMVRLLLMEGAGVITRDAAERIAKIMRSSCQ